MKKAYYCSCSRKLISQTAIRNSAGFIYAGRCREKSLSDGAIRLLTHDKMIHFKDKLQSTFKQNIEQEVGDFILKRSDKQYAYHIAVVIDDHLQNITEIVRGNDLLAVTPRHIYLQLILNYHIPEYLHLPLITHPSGDKLSKQTGAKPLNKKQPVQQLYKVLTMLGQNPDKSLQYEPLNNFWEWAIKNWELARVPRTIPQFINVM